MVSTAPTVGTEGTYVCVIRYGATRLSHSIDVPQGSVGTKKAHELDIAFLLCDSDDAIR